MAKTQREDKDMNKYERVVVTAARTRQLAEGIGVTPEMEGQKITSVAMGELRSGKLKFEDDDEDGE